MLLRQLGACVLGFAAVASAPAAWATGFDVTAQERSVGVATTVQTIQCMPQGCQEIAPPENHADAESAADFSPFDATAAVPSFGGFSASQRSSLSAGTLRAQGSGLHTGTGEYFEPMFGWAHVTSGSSDSHFEASFDVDAPTPYRLRGSVTASGALTANSSVLVRLRTSGGPTIAEVAAVSDPECQSPECATVGPFPLDQVGVLAPGSYVLEASTSGSASPFFFAHSFLSVASTGEYDVELSITEVPALGPGALALLALGLGLSAAPFVARQHRRGCQLLRRAE